MPIQTSPCAPWPLDLSCCPQAEEADPDVVDRWSRVATTILFYLSGRRWGPSCPYTVRPCRRACMDSLPLASSSGGPWVPYLGRDGLWRNASVCGCVSDCSCGELCEVRLEGPVHDVLAVEIDGEVLPPSAYRVDAPGLLVRQDGGCWPDCQDMAAPLGEPGTFGVTYRVGLPLDDAGIAAFSELVCHLLKGCKGAGGSCGCKMPANVTRLSRQGVDQEFADPTLLYSEMRTGLPLTDLWLVAVNPYGRSSASRVYSPDYKRPRSTTWP